MSEEISKLRMCTKCRCTILESFFETNRKGELFKTCNTCRGNFKKQRERRYRYVESCPHCGERIPALHCRRKLNHLKECSEANSKTYDIFNVKCL